MLSANHIVLLDLFIDAFRTSSSASRCFLGEWCASFSSRGNALDTQSNRLTFLWHSIHIVHEYSELFDPENRVESARQSRFLKVP